MADLADIKLKLLTIIHAASSDSSVAEAYITSLLKSVEEAPTQTPETALAAKTAYEDLTQVLIALQTQKVVVSTLVDLLMHQDEQAEKFQDTVIETLKRYFNPTKE